MSAAAKSVFYFGLYLFLTGFALLTVPNILLSTLQMPATNEVWIRVVGVLVIALAFYYQQAGSKNMQLFFPLTVVVRIFVFLSFITFVLLKFVSPALILFGTVDLVGAIWTWWAIRKS